jgi:hypothetical protein
MMYLAFLHACFLAASSYPFSTLSQPYGVQFDHARDLERNMCPNLVPYEADMVAHPRLVRPLAKAHTCILIGICVGAALSHR